MIVFRLAKKPFCSDLSGKGAEIAGGRWNSKGTAMVYTSESRALCMAEVAVHTQVGIIPENYFLAILEIPDKISFGIIDIRQLPDDWNGFPHSHVTQKLGDDFIAENKFLVLKVPSAVVKGDFNYLINPRHPEHQKIKIIQTEPFSFDERLFR